MSSAAAVEVQHEEVVLEEKPKTKKRTKRVEYVQPPKRERDATTITEEAWLKGAKRVQFAFTLAKVFEDGDNIAVEVPRRAGRANSGIKTLLYSRWETLDGVRTNLLETMKQQGVHTLDVTSFAARYPDLFWNAVNFTNQDQDALEKWLANDCAIPNGQRRRKK